MVSQLPNLRLFCLPSEGLGQDWFAVSSRIDEEFPLFGMELSEESIYFIYDSAPGMVKDGGGSCLIGRPVIGAKRAPSAPFQLVDIVSHKVHRERLRNMTWPMVFEEAYSCWERLIREGKTIGHGFMLHFRRKLNSELEFEVEVIFKE